MRYINGRINFCQEDVNASNSPVDAAARATRTAGMEAHVTTETESSGHVLVLSV